MFESRTGGMLARSNSRCRKNSHKMDRGNSLSSRNSIYHGEAIQQISKPGCIKRNLITDHLGCSNSSMKFQLPRSSVQKSIPHRFQWFPLSYLAYGMGTTLYDCSLTEQLDFVIYRLFQEGLMSLSFLPTFGFNLPNEFLKKARLFVLRIPVRHEKGGFYTNCHP